MIPVKITQLSTNKNPIHLTLDVGWVEKYKTVTGNPIVISDGVKDTLLKKLQMTLAPKQSGSGTPSPTNVRPISGWDEVETVVSGVNQWDEQWEVYGSNGQIKSKTAIHLTEGATYYAKTPIALTLYFKATADGATVSSAPVNNGTFTVPTGCHYAMMYTGTGYGNTYNNDISINYPSTDHEYHAYQGHTYTTDLPQTVYGGTLDVVSGVLTVDMKYDQMTYAYLSSLTSPYIGFASGVTQVGGNAVWVRNWNYTDYPANIDGGIKAKCNAFPISMHNKAIFSSQYRTYFGVGSMTSVDEFLSAVQTLETSGNGLWIAHELATPTTIQCDPQTVSLLAGENVIMGDGDMEITYRVKASA